MENFLPEDYKLPTSSKYLKLTEGKHKFRVMSSAIVGFQYFTNENKPIRQREAFDGIPQDIKSGGRVNPFWAFIIWNYEEEKLQILELTQKTIMMPMKSLVEDESWGNPKNYDITITRKGTGLNDTEYSVMPNPHTDIPAEVAEAYETTNINLEALYKGEDPFALSEL